MTPERVDAQGVSNLVVAAAQHLPKLKVGPTGGTAAGAGQGGTELWKVDELLLWGQGLQQGVLPCTSLRPAWHL